MRRRHRLHGTKPFLVRIAKLQEASNSEVGSVAGKLFVAIKALAGFSLKTGTSQDLLCPSQKSEALVWRQTEQLHGDDDDDRFHCLKDPFGVVVFKNATRITVNAFQGPKYWM